MAGELTVRIDGFTEAAQTLGKMKRATGKAAVRRVARKALEPVRADAAARAPEDTGLLEDRVIISARQRGGRGRRRREGPNEVYLALGPAREATVRGQMQEFGTFKEPAQPWLRPAWEAGKDRVLAQIARDLGAEIMKTAARVARRAGRT